MAGVLDLKLAGPRVYGETSVGDAFMGQGRREARTANIRRALRLYRRGAHSRQQHWPRWRVFGSHAGDDYVAAISGSVSSDSKGLPAMSNDLLP
jgi:hypothetical protein